MTKMRSAATAGSLVSGATVEQCLCPNDCIVFFSTIFNEHFKSNTGTKWSLTLPLQSATAQQEQSCCFTDSSYQVTNILTTIYKEQ